MDRKRTKIVIVLPSRFPFKLHNLAHFQLAESGLVHYVRKMSKASTGSFWRINDTPSLAFMPFTHSPYRSGHDVILAFQYPICISLNLHLR